MRTISNNSQIREDETSHHTLSTAGIRVTGQRALILEIIRQGQGHLDAVEIYRQASIKQPRLSLSTVYRTMQILKRLGLVEEVHIDDTHHHYEPKQATDHYHLVCLGCGAVIEFTYPLAHQITTGVPDAKEFQIVNTDVRITGYCSRCRQQRG